MANIRSLLIGLIGLTAIVVVSSSNIGNYRQHDKSHQFYYVSTGLSNHTIAYEVSPALSVEMIVFKHPKPEYLYPVNDGKHDNRLLSYYQYQISYNIATHYRS